MSEKPAAWSRRRLLALLAAGAVVLGLLAAGLVVSVATLLRPDETTTAAAAGATAPVPTSAPVALSGPARRDAIAAAPMRPVTLEEALPGRPATTPAAAVTVPPATTTDPLGVPTGFPHTPEGALGQLAAVGSTVLGRLSVADAHAVYAAWSQPGGVGADQWRLVRDIATFVDGLPQPVLLARPAAAQVKGTDGPDWLVGCVLFGLSAPTVPGRAAQIAYGYCERLAWQEGRWVIAPGAAPAEPPHTWPSTQAAAEAGWRTWVDAAEEVS